MLLLKDSKVGTLTEHELTMVLKVAGFPEEAEVALPAEGDRADMHKPGWVCFYTYPFRVGHVFPFSPLVQSLLRHFNIAPGQLMPHSWRVLRVLEEVVKKHDLPFGLADLMYSYFLNPSGPGRFILQLKPSQGTLVLGTKAGDRGWNNKFFFVRVDSLGGAGGDFLSTQWVSAGIVNLGVPSFCSLFRLLFPSVPDSSDVFRGSPGVSAHAGGVGRSNGSADADSYWGSDLQYP